MTEQTDDADAMLERLKQSVTSSGLTALLCIEPLLCWQGASELVIELEPKLLQHHGFAHGAIVGAAADNACAWAAASVAGDVVTASYTLHLLAPAKGERLRAKGQVIKSGKRTVTVQASVFAEDRGVSRLVATALASVARLGS